MGFAKRMAGRGDAPPRDHYAEVTHQIIAELERGVRPWRKTWNGDIAGGSNLAPRNGATGRRYRGINILLLSIAGFAYGPDPRWLTYRQAEERGWQVRRGERGTRVFFYRQLAVRDRGEGRQPEIGGGEGSGETRRIPLLRAFTVFHATQIDGIHPFLPASLVEAPWQTPEAVEVIARNSGAVIRYGGDRAFYSPSTDHIGLPPDAAFESPEAATATKLHELGHWTGHPTRLARNLSGRFGSEAYAQEELRAELASVFLGAELGLACDIPNHADYLASWLKTLREDKREIFRAASDAQRIADYLLGFHPEHARRLAEERLRDGEAEERANDDAAPVAAAA